MDHTEHPHAQMRGLEVRAAQAERERDEAVALLWRCIGNDPHPLGEIDFQEIVKFLDRIDSESGDSNGT